MPAAITSQVEGLLHRFFASARPDAWFERDEVPVADVRETMNTTTRKDGFGCAVRWGLIPSDFSEP